MNVYIESSGCDSNKADMSMVGRYFKKNGNFLIDSPKDANIIVYMSCGFNETKRQENLKRIHELKGIRGARLYVGGCLPSIDKEVKNMVDGTFGPRTINSLDYLFDQKDSIDFESPYFNRENRRVIRVSTGCEGSCSYCVIKKANGKTKSRSSEDIKDDMIHATNKEGINKFLLVSEDVGAWGQDIGKNLTDLLDDILISDYHRVSLSTISPEWFLKMPLAEQFYGYYLEHAVYLAFQSGSDKILKAMNRNYTAEQYSDVVNDLTRRYSDMKIISDVIVGFPGETENDFEKSLEMIQDLDIHFLQVFKYTDMQGTPASRMPNKVDERTKIERSMRAMNLFINKIKPTGRVGNLVNTNLTLKEMLPFLDKEGADMLIT